MKKKQLFTLLLTTTLILSGCKTATSPVANSKDITPTTTVEPSKDIDVNSKDITPIVEPTKQVEDNTINPVIDTAAITKEFEELISAKDVTIESLFTFLDNLPSSLPTEYLSNFLFNMEAIQNDILSAVNERYHSEGTQEAFQHVSQEDMNDVSKLSTTALIDLVTFTHNEGFKVETAEGFYYPVIDYSRYVTYASSADEETNEYFNIMTIESDVPFAKDAALLIGWDEVIERGLRIEAFMNLYPESSRLDIIEMLYDRYEYTALFGLNNTPLFDYDTKTIQEDAKKIYESLLSTDTNSNYLKNIKGFFDIVMSNNGMLNQEAEDFRTSIIY